MYLDLESCLVALRKGFNNVINSSSKLETKLKKNIWIQNSTLKILTSIYLILKLSILNIYYLLYLLY